MVITKNFYSLEISQLNAINADLKEIYPYRNSLRFIFIIGTGLRVPTVQEVLKSLVQLKTSNLQVVYVDPVSPIGFAKDIADIHIATTADRFAFAIKNAVNPHDRMTRLQPIPDKRITRPKKKVAYKQSRIYDDPIYKKSKLARK